MKKIGITGQQGFIGSYLYNVLSLLNEEFTLVPFKRSFFLDTSALDKWTKQCDVIVHLAAMNRHESQQFIHDTNITLVQRLIDSLKRNNHSPHLLFSSSTQEEKDNLYGQSKKYGRQALVKWANEYNAIVTGLIIPNVFGPFGKPFYNSVIATFCYQLCNNQNPKIDIDGSLRLIYVGELATIILDAIRSEKNEANMEVAATSERKVSEILALLNAYKEQYFDQGILPELNSVFELNLFNTFRSFIDLNKYFPFHYKQNEDNRGKFVELVKLHQTGQVSFSTTRPGITRGNHFHTRKIERFAVIKGKACIQLRKYNTTEVINIELNGKQSSYVDMPVWYAHNITNIGSEELITVFWINEFYDPADPDTYFETV